MMQFRILGSLEVLDGDTDVPLGGARQRAVLAILLLHRGEVLSNGLGASSRAAPPVPPVPLVPSLMP